MIRFQGMCLELITLCCLAGWASGNIPSKVYTGTYVSTGYQFHPKDDYKPMTNDFDVILIGTIKLPPCIKNLMNCWEMLNPDILCKYKTVERAQLNFDTICMDLRFQCREYTGPKPFPKIRDISDLLNMCDHAITLNTVAWVRGVYHKY